MGILVILFIMVPISIVWCQAIEEQTENRELAEHVNDPNYWGWLD